MPYRNGHCDTGMRRMEQAATESSDARSAAGTNTRESIDVSNGMNGVAT